MREVFPSHRSVLFSDEEAVRTRSGLESHEAVRRADVGQGRILGKGFAVGFDLRNVGCRNAERGRRIAGISTDHDRPPPVRFQWLPIVPYIDS